MKNCVENIISQAKLLQEKKRLNSIGTCNSSCELHSTNRGELLRGTVSAGQQRLGSCETLFFEYYFKSNRMTGFSREKLKAKDYYFRSNSISELSREKINAGYQRLDSYENCVKINSTNCVKNILQEKNS